MYRNCARTCSDMVPLQFIFSFNSTIISISYYTIYHLQLSAWHLHYLIFKSNLLQVKEGFMRNRF